MNLQSTSREFSQAKLNPASAEYARTFVSEISASRSSEVGHHGIFVIVMIQLLISLLWVIILLQLGSS